MAKALRVVGTIAGVVAVVAPFFGPVGMAIAAVATVVAVVATIGAALLQKKPPTRGSVFDINIGANQPMPCVLGRSYSGGVMALDRGYGATLKKVPNPYRSQVFAWSLGPAEAVEGVKVDFAAPSAYYTGWLTTSTQLGATPEASALAGPYGAIPNWGASYKLSGLCAGMFSEKFDKDGKVFASGLPVFGAVVKGPKVYDPRQDSTYPGGSGGAAAGTDSTYVGGAAAQNPACHGITYALGRYQNGKKVFGCGLAAAAIDLPAWVAFANVCDANGWTISGIIYEPGSRWDNLKRICQAGGAVPVWTGGKLSVKYNVPVTALDTIEADDLGEGVIRIPATRSYRDRINTIVPKCTSEAHRWETVQLDAITNAAYVTMDGEERLEEYPLELVSSANQAAQLATYRLVNMREIAGIAMTLKPRFLEYRMGDCLQVGASLAGETALAKGQLLVITSRKIDIEKGTIDFTFDTETNSKHAFALGKTGTVPPVPTLVTGEEADEVAAAAANPSGYISELIRNSYVTGSGGSPLTATDAGASATISIAAHDRAYADMTVAVSGASLTGLAYSTAYNVYYDDGARAGGAVTYVATTSGDAFQTASKPDRHFVGYISTPASGAPPVSGGGSGPPGSGGGTLVP